jgi:NodT family efflux transporter outer membrane factor (OMF) lipoprotein
VFEASAQQAIYSLGVLLALEPSALVEELSPLSSIPAAPPEVPMLLPADLLLRRPDVRRAEAQIHGATARIGVATADLFPRFNLTGSAGFRGDAINEWLKWSNRVWSFGPAMDWQIFSAGRVTSNIELQRAIQEEAFLAYQKVVLTAFQDVENSLVTYAKEQERRKALLEAVTANRKAVDLATQLYIQGETDFLNVLNAQRSLYVSEDALVQSTRNLSTGLVALYKALGGGWDIESKADDSLEVDRGGLKTSPASQVAP